MNKVLKLNNKGFAITTILFGTMVLFMLLMASLLGILSTYQNNLNRLIEESNGSRSIVIMKADKTTYATEDAFYDDFNRQSGLYCFADNTCKYLSASVIPMRIA